MTTSRAGHGSSLRVLAPMPHDQVLGLEGWERRFVGGPPRLEELGELYRTLGLDVRLEPLTPTELAGMCRGCDVATGEFRVLYTRRRS